jgi:hypothetical protein
MTPPPAAAGPTIGAGEGESETAALLNRIAERGRLADRHEAEALRWAGNMDADSTARAAHHFIVAEGLRGRARGRP